MEELKTKNRKRRWCFVEQKSLPAFWGAHSPPSWGMGTSAVLDLLSKVWCHTASLTVQDTGLPDLSQFGLYSYPVSLSFIVIGLTLSFFLSLLSSNLPSVFLVFYAFQDKQQLISYPSTKESWRTNAPIPPHPNFSQLK